MQWGARMMTIGIVIMVVTESATLFGIEPFASWNTPIAWTGFILFADAFVYRARGESWIRTSPRGGALHARVSIPLWIVFEGYNLIVENWYYTGLPENFWLREFGYAWSFATIWPAMFEAADLVAVLRGRRGDARTPGTAREPEGVDDAPLLRGPALVWMAAGALMLALPFVVPDRAAACMAAPVWLGFVFLLDPINRRLGGETITRRRSLNLAIGGLLCGFLWEFWNYWARAKWHYTVPIFPNVKIFEMPVLGYLGFPAFALECFTMYVFVRALSGKLGRTIAL